MLREFFGDLGKSVGAWFKAPLLPLFALALHLPWYLQVFHLFFNIASVLAGIFIIGYVGTERLWYLAIWEGWPFPMRKIWRTSWRYFSRYLVLGIIATVANVILWLLVALVLTPLDAPFLLSVFIATLFWDVWLTFMTPALAYTTNNVGESMSIGWRFLRQNWRRGFLYVLAPPLASLLLLQRSPEESLQTSARLGLAALGILAYLALKGATAAFYIRHNPDAIRVSEDLNVPEGRSPGPLLDFPDRFRKKPSV